MSKYMTTQEAAAHCRVSVKSLTRWRVREKDPFPAPQRINPGPQQYYSKGDVDAWLKRNYANGTNDEKAINS